MATLRKRDLNAISAAIDFYRDNFSTVETVAETIHRYLRDDRNLQQMLHSLKYRAKDPEHLEGKLLRKALACRNAGDNPIINKDNLLTQVSDLAGIRVLYLRSSQIVDILPAVQATLKAWKCPIVEKPFACTWDDETRDLFRRMKVRTEYRPELYTSVHLVTKLNKSHEVRCEIQLRTLMEEVWGEVSHQINYPETTESIACQEQLKVLARVASGGTRLVDALFASLKEHQDRAAGDSSP